MAVESPDARFHPKRLYDHRALTQPLPRLHPLPRAPRHRERILQWRVPTRGIAGGGGIPRAHTSPIYVHVGGAPTLLRGDVELMIRWIGRLWALLEERNNLGPAANREAARRMIAQARGHFEKKLAQAR